MKVFLNRNLGLWALSFGELSRQKLFWCTMIEHSRNKACQSHLVFFKIIRNELLFYLCKTTFFDILWNHFIKSRLQKRLIKNWFIFFICFAGIEKHGDDCCFIDFNFCSHTWTISISDSITQFSESLGNPGFHFIVHCSCGKNVSHVSEMLRGPEPIRAYHYFPIVIRFARNQVD